MATTPLNVNIDERIKEAVVDLAAREKRTLTATVEILLQQALDLQRMGQVTVAKEPERT